MSNILLAHTNRVDASTMSNGSWAAALPLNNLKDANIDKIARSTNALAASTLFAIDMGAVFPVRALALVNHNFSTAATWQVKGGTAAPDASNVFATGQVFDSGVVNVKQLTFNWDVPSNWGAIYPALFALAAAQSVRYVTVSITDTGNAAGYVQAGRCFVGNGFQPGVNAALGLADSWNELATSIVSQTGKKFFTKWGRQRYVDFQLPYLTAAEGTQVHEMDVNIGVTDEILYVPDPADMAYSQRYGMLATMRELTALEYPHYPERAKAYRLDQKM